MAPENELIVGSVDIELEVSLRRMLETISSIRKEYENLLVKLGSDVKNNIFLNHSEYIYDHYNKMCIGLYALTRMNSFNKQLPS